MTKVLLARFQQFDPVSGHVPERLFSYLPDIARRARSILSGWSSERIDLAARRINEEIDQYFADLKDKAVGELTTKFRADPEMYKDFFECDGGTQTNGIWVYRDEMDEELDIPTAVNSSEVDALKTIIEQRDSCFFLPQESPIPEPDHWPEGKTHELFAVMALMHLAVCLQWTDRSIAGGCALDAMDAVCFAEHVREVDWLEQFHKRQLLKASRSQHALTQAITEKVHLDLIEEQIAHERKKRTTRSELMNAARHQRSKEARDLVCKDWEMVTSKFSSAEKAGIHYAAWLEKQSFGYHLKGKLVFYQPRAVTGWIRLFAKEKGIKFR